ncbi:MAG TPA: hypothetical protein VKP11_12035 [Frankiaceae bacterium]|nr:hypothetical protein [Frankiaceae bacterium]
MRVYLPSTLPAVRRALALLEVPAGPAYAVTPAMREWYAESDEEEMEYAALLAAARASLGLLPVAAGGPRRRVVLAADVPEPQVRVRDDVERGRLELTAPVPLTALRAAHIDGPEAEAAVAAAVAAFAAAGRSDADAASALDEVEGHELLWYATQELADLVA